MLLTMMCGFVQKRKEELQRQREREAEAAENEEFLKETITSSIAQWIKSASNPIARGSSPHVAALLSGLHVLLPALFSEAIVVSPQSAPSDVKRAYLKAVRQVHPDKLGRETVQFIV